MLNVIDVASYQTNIDLTKVPSDAVIIKVTDGTTYVNPACNAQYASAKAAGKRIGLYHFAEPGSDAVSQANFFVNNVRNYLVDEHALPFLDWEADATNLGVNWAKTWLAEVARLTGASPMLYTSKAVTRQFDWTPVAVKYALWGAQYATTAPQYGFIPDPWTDDNAWGAWGVPTIFQYSSNGRLAGWGAGLDLSIAYLDGEGWDKFTNKGGSSEVAKPLPKPVPKYTEAAIDGIFYVDQLIGANGRWYAVNNDISIHPIDFNNWIPLGPLTTTDRYGNRAAKQLLYAGAFFTFGDNIKEDYFPVTYLNDHSICVTIGDEPVWLNRDALGSNLKLR